MQKGNSGGPLLDLSGHVVGVMMGKLDALKLARATGDIPQNVNFAIKGNVARDFMAANGVEAVAAFRRSICRRPMSPSVPSFTPR